jgi:RimJ/RimL family protein N-acetyltransferase
VNIKKDNLTIRPAVRDDAPLLGSWWRDGKIMEHSGYPVGLDITDEKIEKQLLSCSDDTYRLYIIEIDGKPAGEISFNNIGGNDAPHGKTAQIGIKICDFSLHDKGYGTKLLLMFIEALFREKGFEKIVLGVNINNPRARHVYEKIGFRGKGIRYNCWRNQLGELQSVADYEMTNEEFDKLHNLKGK